MLALLLDGQHWKREEVMTDKPINSELQTNSNNDNAYSEQLKDNVSTFMGNSIKKRINKKRVCDDHCISLR